MSHIVVVPHVMNTLNSKQSNSNHYNNFRRDMSNPRSGGGAYMKSRLKQNQDIRETVETHVSKKGRSKSRRQGNS